MQGDMPREKYGTVTETYGTLLKESGTAGLFRGLTWRIGLITTTFFLVNKFKGLIAPVAFPLPDEEDE